MSSADLLAGLSAVSMEAASRARIAALSGWLSIGFWILVYMPQMYENYSLQSGEGLSIFFIFIWLLGDTANFIGAFWQDLLPTISILGMYYVLCDFILLFQVFYYRRRTNRLDLDESVPLLSATATERPWWRQTAAYVLSLGFVALVGGLGYALNRPKEVPGAGEQWLDNAQIVGWVSAILYLSSRFPQIVKNMHTKCEGLSLMFFSFALMGNLTFCASILIPSLSTDHLMINLSWLVGSGGTVVLDMVVLTQFALYAGERRARAEHGKGILAVEEF